MISHRLIILLLHRIVIQNVSWKAKQRSRRITVLPDLLFSTFKAFCFSDVEGFDVHCLLKLMVSKILSRLHHYCYHNFYYQYTFFRLFIHSFNFSRTVPRNLFQKLLLCIFKKRNKMEFQLVCLLVPGRLLSLNRNWRRMAVYQSWDSKAYCLEY